MKDKYIWIGAAALVALYLYNRGKQPSTPDFSPLSDILSGGTGSQQLDEFPFASGTSTPDNVSPGGGFFNGWTIGGLIALGLLI